MFLQSGGRVGAIPLVLSLLPAAVQAQPADGSLRGAFQEAQRLNRTDEGREAAIAALQSLVELHRENEQVNQAALRELARTYAAAGRTEDGMRFFLKIAQEMESQRRSHALYEILNNYRLKDPDLLQQVIQQSVTGAGPKLPVQQPLAADDLARGILQREDEQLRAASLERLRQMLAADSAADQKRTGLATLYKAITAKFDRDVFLPLVVPLLQSEDVRTRMLALRCLPGLEASEHELQLVVPLVEDSAPEVRSTVGLALTQIGKGEQKDIVIPALLHLLSDREPEVIEQTLRAMWGQYSSPELDQRLIELADQARFHHEAIYFGLSTMREKSAAVCRRLVEELADPDWNNSGRAAWGLTYGVPAEARELVEQGLLRALPQETNAYTRKQELRALRGVASDASRAYLTQVAESNLETDEVKQAAREILRGL